MSSTAPQSLAQPANLTISPDLADEDYKPLYLVCYRAYESDPVIPLLYPGGTSKDALAANVEGFKTLFQGPPERLYAKASNAEGQPIAFITGFVYRGKHGVVDDGHGKINPDPPPQVEFPHIPDPKDREWVEWIFNGLATQQRQVQELQTPIAYVQVLATDPDWQRQGAATMLLDWVFGWMKNAGITRCALDAMKPVVDSGFYQHRGFKVVEEATYKDEERFPTKPELVSSVMVKDA